MVGNPDRQFFAKEVRSHVRSSQQNILLLCECIRGLHVALAAFSISEIFVSLCHGCALHSTRGFLFLKRNPAPGRGPTRGFLFNVLEIATLCLLAQKSSSRITNPI